MPTIMHLLCILYTNTKEQGVIESGNNSINGLILCFMKRLSANA
jgi:hypothetical protein